MESLTCEQGKGFTAWVDGHRIVIGGRAMMTAHQVGIPSHDWEERYTHGRLQPVYLAVSGKLFGMFVVGYQGSREIAASLHTLQKSGLSLLVRTDDFSLTSDLIEQAYRLRPGSVKVLTENETNQLATATGYLPESEGCMVHLGQLCGRPARGGLCGFGREERQPGDGGLGGGECTGGAGAQFQRRAGKSGPAGGGAVSVGLGGACPGAAADPQLLTI